MSAIQSLPKTEQLEGEILLQKTMLYVFQYLPFMKTESLLFSAPQDEISVINAALGKLRCHSSSGKNVNVTSFRERERET